MGPGPSDVEEPDFQGYAHTAMLGPVPPSISQSVVCLAPDGLGARDGSALSYEAGQLRIEVNRLARDQQQSQALFGFKLKAFSDLYEMLQQCAQPDWDHAGAMAILPQSIHHTEDFIRALPDPLAMPEFTSDPDGAISMDWIRARHRLLSVSVGPDARLSYAWVNGTNRGYGVVNFDGRSIPPELLFQIKSVFG